MKKTLLAMLLAAMILSACTVGPKEEPRETLATPDLTAIPEIAEPVPEEPENTLPDGISDTEQTAEDIVDVVEDDPITDDIIDDGTDGVEEDIAIDPVDVEVMYATISLNVRRGPSTDYESIGHLNAGQAANILGYAVDYDWYWIEYNGGTGFVSGYYMTDDNPYPEPEEEDYPVIDIDMDRVYEMINAYADKHGYFPTSIEFNGYYGDYSAGAAVALAVILDDVPAAIPLEEVIGDYTLKRPDNISSFFIYTESGDFVLLRVAYANGLVSDSDLRAIKYYTDASLPLAIIGEPRVSSQTYPQLDPLDHAAKAKIAEDYDKANNLESGTAFVVAYYGTYSGGDAVVMWMYEEGSTDVSMPMTDDENEFTVGGRIFYLSSGSLTINIHTKDGKFVPLGSAYEQGLVTEEELDMISYYNLPSWYAR